MAKKRTLMAHGRNSKGKPTDIVKHFKSHESASMTICGRVKWGYAGTDLDETTCLNCLKKVRQGSWYEGR